MINSQPLFSIIIPTYNHAHLIKRCLDSVLNQTFQNWEAIVINNYSEDNTIELVQDYNDSRIRLINNANGGIIAVSRNKGISEAKGNWICFLDSDDWWRKDKLEKCLPYLDQYDLIYHDLVMLKESTINSGEKAFVFKARVLREDIFRDLLINGNPIANSSVVIRKKLVDKIGKITEDRNLIAIEDFDYWVRATFHTRCFLYIRESLGYYWIENNISQGLTQIQKEQFLYMKYSELLSKNDQLTAKKVLNYRIARLYHINDEYRRAYKSYSKAITTRTKFKYFINPIIGFFLAFLHVKK